MLHRYGHKSIHGHTEIRTQHYHNSLQQIRCPEFQDLARMLTVQEHILFFSLNPNLAPRTYSGTSELPMTLVPGDLKFPLASESTYTHYKCIDYLKMVLCPSMCTQTHAYIGTCTHIDIKMKQIFLERHYEFLPYVNFLDIKCYLHLFTLSKSIKQL